jgi:hypothetical protein
MNNLSETVEHLMIDYTSFKKSFNINAGAEIFETRTEEEIYDVIERFTDQIWYNRHQLLKQKVANKETIVNPEIWQGALKAAKKVEKKYGVENLWHESDFEWGMLNGKLSALRWLMGDEWDNLDT